VLTVGRTVVEWAVMKEFPMAVKMVVYWVVRLVETLAAW
jgi:hypothetical protein